MKVLLVGSGAREHALAMAIAASPLCEKLVIAPGNPGMAGVGELAAIGLSDMDGLVSLAVAMKADLVVIGPEAPLAAGLAERVRAQGILCFGPSAAAARIESSKAFAKAFMKRHGIPTADGKSFSDAEQAKRWVRSFDKPVVVKASGLAAGKGVIVPSSLEETEAAIDTLLERGGDIVIEEKLEGEELSLIALCDGTSYKVLPAACDHKRLKDGDKGPNTGGMGAFAPACTIEEAEQLARIVIEPAMRGLAEERTPFVGALYAGLMLTREGPKVLEYNARFGDPETQVILPLIRSDLLVLLEACARGTIGVTPLELSNSSAAVCIVLASKGYPERPVTEKPIRIGMLPERAFCLHAGTKKPDAKTSSANKPGTKKPDTNKPGDELVSAGGRVLSVVGLGASLEEARALAYEAVAQIHFDGMQYRSDIGNRADRVAKAIRAALGRAALHDCKSAESAYARAGVDIDAGNRAVELMKDAVRSTYGPEVVAGIGAFGGQFDASGLKRFAKPVLVASTDGVGTKTSLGLALGRLEGLGMDIVNHSINDILVQGARPLFFMDYIAAGKLDPEHVAKVVSGMAHACRLAGCALLGGETAEMPGTYQAREMDIAGTIVGVADAERLLPRSDLLEGDILLGLASSGLHTNGYSLARAIVADRDLEAVQPALGESLADALLRPHRSYLPLLARALDAQPSPVKALAHITGGGMIENIPRILPPHLDARIRADSWTWPPLFRLLQAWGSVSDEEMRRVFNLGIGMVVIVGANETDRMQALLPEPAFVIGKLVPGSGKVLFA